MIKNSIAISCWFGERFQRPYGLTSLSDFIQVTKYYVKTLTPLSFYDALNVRTVVPQAPQGIEQAVFFTNNKKLKKEVLQKGWIYKFMPTEVDTENSIQSSLHAKKVKFLQFDEDLFSKYLAGKYVFYMDSRCITDQADRLIVNAKMHAIVIRHTPRVKLSVWDEVNEAKEQARYLKGMPSTIKYIEDELVQGKTTKVRICATGIIVYNFTNDEFAKPIRALIDGIYQTCQILQQPECQIIWAMESQKFPSLIKTVPNNFVSTRDT